MIFFPMAHPKAQPRIHKETSSNSHCCTAEAMHSATWTGGWTLKFQCRCFSMFFPISWWIHQVELLTLFVSNIYKISENRCDPHTNCSFSPSNLHMPRVDFGASVLSPALQNPNHNGRKDLTKGCNGSCSIGLKAHHGSFVFSTGMNRGSLPGN